MLPEDACREHLLPFLVVAAHCPPYELCEELFVLLREVVFVVLGFVDDKELTALVTFLTAVDETLPA